MLHRTTMLSNFLSTVRSVSLIAFASLAGLAGGTARAQVFVTEVSAPAAGSYDRTLALHFTATFSAPVVISGAPRLALRVGDRIRHATWLAPLGPTPPTRAITFVYHPEPLDLDEDGIAVIPQLDLNGGTIEGVDTAPVQLAFAAPDTRAVFVTLRRPPAPRVLGLTSGSQTNATPAAAGNSFVLRGTADGGSRVSVDLVEVGTIGSATATDNGSWSMPYPTSLLSPGTHRLIATAENSAGLVSAPSEPIDIRVQSAPSPRAEP